jgi:anti-repressor protein
VAKALGYENPSRSVNDHCKKVSKFSPTESVVPYNIINQGDVLRLIVRSTLPQAQKIEEWIFEEVVPSVLKHGAYMTPQTIKDIIKNPDSMLILVQELQQEQEARKALEEEKARNAPAVAFVEELKATGDLLYGDEMAKQICAATELKIGQRKFYNWLRQNGFLFKQDRKYPNVVTQKGVDAGYIIAREEVHGGKIVIVPMFTVAGQMYFVNTFCEMKRNGFVGFDTQGHALYKGEGRAQLSLFATTGG